MNAQIRHYSSTGERPVTNNNTLRAVAGVCGTAVIAGGTYYLWRRYYTTSKSTKSSSSAKDKSSSWPFLLPTSEEITRRLRAREHSVDLPFHPLIQRIDRAQLPSNNPCEDYYCQHALSDGTGYLFGVFDGHSGTACAKWVSKILPARIAEAFARLPKDADAATKGKAMEEAFVSTDDEIVHGSIKRLQTLGMKRPGEINDDKELEETSTWLERALNGSCALVTYVNTQDREVTVALTGDSRVIVGRQNEQGRWQAKVLSEDQTAHNPSERKRIMSEHPGEDDTILARNRVLGGLRKYQNKSYSNNNHS
jgi:pyruvate dehydrogenase phosphatase